MKAPRWTTEERSLFLLGYKLAMCQEMGHVMMNEDQVPVTIGSIRDPERLLNAEQFRSWPEARAILSLWLNDPRFDENMAEEES